MPVAPVEAVVDAHTEQLEHHRTTASPSDPELEQCMEVLRSNAQLKKLLLRRQPPVHKARTLSVKTSNAVLSMLTVDHNSPGQSKVRHSSSDNDRSKGNSPIRRFVCGAGQVLDYWGGRDPTTALTNNSNRGGLSGQINDNTFILNNFSVPNSSGHLPKRNRRSI